MFMKPLFKKKKKLSASSLLLAGLFLCIVLSVGCSVVKNTSGKKVTVIRFPLSALLFRNTTG